MARFPSRLGPVSLPNYHMISAYVRIAHKYQMDAILAEWIDYLKLHFTRSYVNWKAHAELLPPGFDLIHVIGVVNLARLVTCPSILITALAVCTALGPEIVHGFLREDGQREMLSPDDLGRVFNAKGQLVQANAMATIFALCPAVADMECKTPEECCKAITETFTEFCDWRRDDLLASLEFFPQWAPIRECLKCSGICLLCAKCLAERYDQELGNVWLNLPQIVNVQM